MKLFASAAIGLTLLSALPAQAQTIRRCSEFATQPEAQYHLLMGFAGAELDDDRNGLACEMLPTAIAPQGIATNRISQGNYGYQLRQSQGRFTVEATYRGQPVFSTLLFASQSAAEQYARQFIPASSDRAAQVLQLLSGN
jgi:hypothetical protein